jgi:GTPase
VEYVFFSGFLFLYAAAADGIGIYLSIQAVRQTVRIVTIDHPQNLLRTGDRATVIFEFIAHPEFVKAGMKLLFREGKTKVEITKLFFWELITRLTVRCSM